MSFQVGKELLKKFLTDHDAFMEALRNNKTWLIESFNKSMVSVDGTIMSHDELVQHMNNYFNSSLESDLMPSSEEYIYSMPSIKVFFYCLYILIFVIGVFGNALVCFVVVRNKNMQTVTNLFITNLALSDILLCLFAVPFTPLYLLTFRSWVFGKLFCHLLPYAQGVSVYISAFTLMSIAIDRFFVIIYPFKPRMKIKVCFFIIACVWVAAGILTFPYGWFMDIVTDGDQSFCDEGWPRDESKKAFGFSTAVLQFVIPFTIISFCYMKVCCKLRERARSKPGAKSARKEEIERERTRRTNRMLISMVVIFGASWLPLNINNLIQDFYTPATTWHYARAFFLLAHAIAMSSTCYNPFLYAWLNDNFRKEFKQVLPCFRLSRSRRGGSSFPRGGSEAGGGGGGHQRSHRREYPLTPRDNPDFGNIPGSCNGRHEMIQLHEHLDASAAKGKQRDNQLGENNQQGNATTSTFLPGESPEVMPFMEDTEGDDDNDEKDIETCLSREVSHSKKSPNIVVTSSVNLPSKSASVYVHTTDAVKFKLSKSPGEDRL